MYDTHHGLWTKNGDGGRNALAYYDLDWQVDETGYYEGCDDIPVCMCRCEMGLALAFHVELEVPWRLGTWQVIGTRMVIDLESDGRDANKSTDFDGEMPAVRAVNVAKFCERVFDAYVCPCLRTYLIVIRTWVFLHVVCADPKRHRSKRRRSETQSWCGDRVRYWWQRIERKKNQRDVGGKKL